MKVQEVKISSPKPPISFVRAVYQVSRIATKRSGREILTAEEDHPLRFGIEGQGVARSRRSLIATFVILGPKRVHRGSECV
jgi:hypothetical protein